MTNSTFTLSFIHTQVARYLQPFSSVFPVAVPSHCGSKLVVLFPMERGFASHTALASMHLITTVCSSSLSPPVGPPRAYTGLAHLSHLTGLSSSLRVSSSLPWAV